MNSMEHIMYRHSPTNDWGGSHSYFSAGTTPKQVMGWVDDALRYGNVTQTGPTSYTVEHRLGQVIGVNVRGEASNAIRVHVRDGIIRTAFPI